MHVRQAAAKQGDQIIAQDSHIVMVQAGSAMVPTQLLHPFNGIINGALSSNVNIMKKPAATVDSTADNTPPHLPTLPGQGFQNPPTNLGKIVNGSSSVRINGKAAARNGDMAETCNDPTDMPVGQVVAVGSVQIG
jgi:uncharacterized Zn-binding protein involved in type VI secretion